MRIFLLVILISTLKLKVFTCEHIHTYDADVIALIESEGDTYLDSFLYEDEEIRSQFYGIEPENSQKILKQAQYAFDTFRYQKCLEKIKEYERVAFPPPYDFPSPQEKLMILAYKAYANRFSKTLR